MTQPQLYFKIVLFGKSRLRDLMYNDKQNFQLRGTNEKGIISNILYYV